MKIEKEIAKKIARDVSISVFIYALPVALMFGWFYIKGEKPWEKKITAPVENTKTH
ncbi:MAG: hypothetical protein QM791_07610 [Ferruginibacter sp.]